MGFPNIEQTRHEFNETWRMLRLAHSIYERKRSEAMEAGTYKFVGLLKRDPLADEALKEAADIVRGTNY